MDVILLSLNCAKRQQPQAEFKQLILNVLPDSPPDFLIIGLQEACAIVRGALGWTVDTDSDIRRVVFNTLKHRYSTALYNDAITHWCGALAIFIFPREFIPRYEVARVSFGYFWSSLKGAVGIRLFLNNMAYTFVNVHLSANEGQGRLRRNADFKILANGLRFPDSGGIYELKKQHLFVFGDLNYRATKRAYRVDEAADLLEEFESIDELSLERFAGRTMYSLHEASVSFAPTYKYLVDSNIQDCRRTPSWCDRVLYSDKNIGIVKYDSVSAYTGSDHRPVYLHAHLNESAELENCTIAPTWVLPTQYSVCVDKVLGSVLYLAEHRIMMLIYSVLVLLFIRLVM